MMRITIDGTFQTEPVAGLKRYFEMLLTHLASIDTANEYQIYYNMFRDRDCNVFQINQENFRTRRNPIPRRLFEKFINLFSLNHSPFIGTTDLVHFPNHYSYPVSNRTKSVVTIHDISYKIYPEHLSREIIEQLEPATEDTLRRVDGIIAISENTKKDLMEFYEIDPQKIKVIHIGADFSDIDVDESVARDEFNIEEPYILSVSTIQPRKNFKRLMHAYKIVKDDGIPHKLVIAGRFGWLYEDILKRRTELSLEEDVIFTGQISDKLLISFYKGADIFIYPSLYEGFGLPPLEASFYGVPVICSKTSSLPEVMGEACIYVNPESVEDIATGIMSLTDDDEKKSQLIEKGYENLKRFSWEKCARETLELYRSLI